MSEPTYEELKARVAELEKQKGGRRTGSLEFRAVSYTHLTLPTICSV